MRILLDTHIFLWSISEPEKIPSNFRESIESLANEILVSAVSISEIMIKSSIGKLEISFHPVQEVHEAGFSLIPFTGEEAIPLKELPFHHRDPFDRMLIAQSLVQDIPIMTCDRKFSAYTCKLC
jgi:PIN domain nuclease of toxin-antitoxin system